MSGRRDRRGDKTGKLGTKRGERYALVTEEVLMSDAYAAQPDYSKVVLVALAARYHGGNNGDLSLPIAEARKLGVAHPWKLYAGLQLLMKAELIQRTRQGLLERGVKVCSLYALTWRPINKPPEGVTYDAGVSVNLMPSHLWVKWEKPADWLKVVRDVASANHGQKKPIKRSVTIIPVSTTGGNGRSTTGGNGRAVSDQLRGVTKTAFSVPTVVDTSKTLVGGHTNNSANKKKNTVKPAPLSRAPLQTKKLTGSRSKRSIN